MDNMSIQDYAAMQNIMGERSHAWGKGAGIWAIVAVIIIAFLVIVWQKNCNEKVQFATSLARLDGRVDAIEPAVTSQGNNIYKINGVLASTVQGVGDLKECVNDKIDFLENQVLFQRRRGGCGCNDGCGNREFRQTSTYNLASTNVTVDETCRN